MRKLIPYSCQYIDEKDIQEVVKVLKSSSITQGPKVGELENALCKYTGARYAVLFNSGTSALHGACLAAGVGPQDEVITSSNTFVASANCAVYCGAKPVFADINLRTYNIDPLEMEKKINQYTKAVIPVHFAGQVCDMKAVKGIIERKVSKYQRKIYIIEDACHALGSFYNGEKCGSGIYSDMTVMSFHPVKHITTGEGGVVLTNDKELCYKLQRFRSHGITSIAEEFKDKKHAFSLSGVKNPWYYEQQFLGYNYRITEIQCALGFSQLKKLPFFIRKRRKIAAYYNEAFRNNEFLQVPYEAPECISNWHLYVVCFDFPKMGVDRARFMSDLKQRGIQTQVHYTPVYAHPFYRENFGTNWGDCCRSEQYYAQCLSIPLFPVMTDEEINKVISVIRKLVKSYK